MFLCPQKTFIISFFHLFIKVRREDMKVLNVANDGLKCIFYISRDIQVGAF